MNRLIKAENYRFRCVSGFKGIYVALAVLLFLLPICYDWELWDKNLGEAMESMTGMSIGLMMLPIYIALWTVSGYSKKTAYYEIMAGSRISHILGSKMISIGLLQSAGFLAAAMGIGIFVTLMNGVGTVSSLGWRILLLIVVFFHMCLVTVLMSLAIKQGLAAALAAYCRFWILEVLVVMLLGVLYNRGYVSDAFCQVVQGQLLQEQLSKVLLGEVTARMIAEVLTGFALEVVMWYSIAYVTMKKKLYE